MHLLVAVLIVFSLVLVGLFFSESGASGSATSMPQYVATAVLLMLLFTKTRVNNPLLCRIIAKVAPLTFGVYIIHLHPCVWDNVRHVLYQTEQYNALWWFLPAASLALFTVCLLIDYCRSCLFRICRAEILVQWITRSCIWAYQSTVGKMIALIEENTDDLQK